MSRKNPNWVAGIAKRLRKATKEVAVGFPKAEQGIAEVNPTYAKKGHNVSILEVAVWNNFGTNKIPRRPFMEQAKPKLEEAFSKLKKAHGRNLLRDDTQLDKMLHIAAVQSEAIVKAEITDGGFVPDAPQTVMRKKSSQPLIDSGDMRKYATAVVRESK
jgi:hypothetical protein